MPSKVITCLSGLNARVERRLAAGAWARLWAQTTRRPIVGSPLPDVPRYVVESEAVGWEQAHRRRSAPSLRAGVVPGKLALPEICHQLSPGLLIAAPSESRAVERTACRVLPLRLGWQLLAGPLRIGLGILECDVGDRMIGPHGVLAVRSPGTAPARVRNIGPPATRVVQRHRSRGGMKDGRPLAQQRWVGVGIGGRVR